MKSTLSQYVESSNIPKKYGGTLDWGWGDLPNLDPAIANTLKWEHPGKDAKGNKAFPAGPVKWKKTSHGDIVAVAVGSEHGRKREETVAMMPVRNKYLNIGPVLSPQVSNTDYSAFGPASTSGTYTHPPPGQDYFATSGNTPTEEEDEPYNQRKMSLPSREVQGPTSGEYFGSSTQSNAPPQQSTSTTHYQQQQFSHTNNQGAEATPALVDHGYGDKTRTIQPATVGQAPKHVNVPETDTSEAVDNSYLGQAKAAAGSVYTTATSVLGAASSTVTSTLGYGETSQQKEEETQPTETTKPKPYDTRVDQLQNEDVEDFIRSKYATHPEWSK